MNETITEIKFGESGYLYMGFKYPNDKKEYGSYVFAQEDGNGNLYTVVK